MTSKFLGASYIYNNDYSKIKMTHHKSHGNKGLSCHMSNEKCSEV